MFQDLKLFESRTVWENVSFPLHIQGLSRRQLREQVQNVLSVVEMEKKPDLKVQLLSSAERTRVALARAMVRRPSCLLADEPFASLTKAGAQEVNELFRRANTMGTTVLIATRDQKLAESNGQRVIYLQDGAAHYQDPALAAAQAKEADDAKK
jgi:cell division transport system ATP-binding protein